MLELALDADPASLATLADAVEAFAAAHGVPQDRTMQLIVALDEVVTNALTHGGLFPGMTIKVAVDVVDDEVSALVEDPGPAFDPLHEAPAPPLSGALEDRPIGGLGLHIVRTIMRDLGYERVDGRNRLTMRLAL